jgi:hypothetical protein
LDWRQLQRKNAKAPPEDIDTSNVRRSRATANRQLGRTGAGSFPEESAFGVLDAAAVAERVIPASIC